MTEKQPNLVFNQINTSSGLQVLSGMAFIIEASRGKKMESMRVDFQGGWGDEKSMRLETFAAAGKMV